MFNSSRGVRLVAIALAAASFCAPLASANADPPSIPQPGSEPAAATIRDLDAAGYDVQIQYENGVAIVPLSQCAVTDIDTNGSAGSQPLAYVTINCPQ